MRILVGHHEVCPTRDENNNKHTKHHMKKLVTLSAVLLVAILVQGWQMAYAQTNAPKAKE